MPFSAILLVFKFLMFSFLQVCKFTDLQVHNSIDCPYFYGLSVKISDLLYLNTTLTKIFGKEANCLSERGISISVNTIISITSKKHTLYEIVQVMMASTPEEICCTNV